jgi:hypothetical protein
VYYWGRLAQIGHLCLVCGHFGAASDTAKRGANALVGGRGSKALQKRELL